MNVKLQNNFSSLQFQYPHMFTSINVGKLTVEETIDFIIDFWNNSLYLINKKSSASIVDCCYNKQSTKEYKLK